MTFWHAFFEEIDTPSNQPGPLHRAYQRAVTGIAHMVLGAALAAVLAPDWALGALALRLVVVAAVYWLAKERGDLRRGGTLADGLEDAALVALGSLYPGPWLAPVAALAAGLYLMWRGYRAG